MGKVGPEKQHEEARCLLTDHNESPPEHRRSLPFDFDNGQATQHSPTVPPHRGTQRLRLCSTLGIYLLLVGFIFFAIGDHTGTEILHAGSILCILFVWLVYMICCLCPPDSGTPSNDNLE